MMDVDKMVLVFFFITFPALALMLIIGFIKKKKIKKLLKSAKQTEGTIIEIEYQSGAEANPRMKAISYEYLDNMQVTHKRSFRWQGKTPDKGEHIAVYYHDQNHGISLSDIELNYWNSFFQRMIPSYLMFVGLCVGIYLIAFIAKKN